MARTMPHKVFEIVHSIQYSISDEKRRIRLQIYSTGTWALHDVSKPFGKPILLVRTHHLTLVDQLLEKAKLPLVRGKYHLHLAKPILRF